MASEIEASPSGESVLVERMVSGRIHLSAKREELTAGPHDDYLMDPDAAQHIRWEPGLRVHILRLHRPTLERIAAELSGRDERRPLHLPLSSPLSPERAEIWRTWVNYVTKGFATNPAMLESPLLQAETMRHTTALLLHAFPSAVVNTLPPSGGHVRPVAVRRAVEYVERSASEPVSLTDIATAARTSVRALQQAFRHHLDTTPMAYVRRVRLERAHAELEKADPSTGVTVLDVAIRWGFSNPGRFASEYRRVYGRNPRETLDT